MAGKMPPAVMPSRGMEKRKSQLMALAPLATMIARMTTTGSTTSRVASEQDGEGDLLGQARVHGQRRERCR